MTIAVTKCASGGITRALTNVGYKYVVVVLLLGFVVVVVEVRASDECICSSDDSWTCLCHVCGFLSSLCKEEAL